MKINKIKLLVTTIALCVSATAVAASQDKVSGGTSVNIPVTQLKYFDTGIGKNSGVGTLHAAAAYGDHATWSTWNIYQNAGWVCQRSP